MVVTSTVTLRAYYGWVAREGDKTFTFAGGAHEGFDRPRTLTMSAPNEWLLHKNLSSAATYTAR